MKFGTDGVRGVANIELTPEFALALGKAAGKWLRNLGGSSAVIGRDTRQSGTMLGAALAAGFNSVGVDVTSVAVAPTPAISYLARVTPFDLGVVISASHNPAEDNGIKFLGRDGRKLSDEQERTIETLLNSHFEVSSSTIGQLISAKVLLNEYENWLAEQLPEGLSSVKLAVDCANGAASEIAPRVFERLGAEVHVINATPDGWNINLDCGATNPATIQKYTMETSSDIGIAFDGDADRCILSDEEGNLINGDRMMGVWAHYWKVEPPTVVGTVMSNMGFETALQEHGFKLLRTNVGDRYVAQEMSLSGSKVGGEQSGHIIFSEFAPTGDGILTALQFLRILQRTGEIASQLPPKFANWPQVLLNVAIQNRDAWASASTLHQEIDSISGTLGSLGRVNVRPSGTQPVLRIMVEAKDVSERDRVAEHVLERVIQTLGGRLQSKVDLTNALGD